MLKPINEANPNEQSKSKQEAIRNVSGRNVFIHERVISPCILYDIMFCGQLCNNVPGFITFPGPGFS